MVQAETLGGHFRIAASVCGVSAVRIDEGINVKFGYLAKPDGSGLRTYQEINHSLKGPTAWGFGIMVARIYNDFCFAAGSSRVGDFIGIKVVLGNARVSADISGRYTNDKIGDWTTGQRQTGITAGGGGYVGTIAD